MHVLIADDHEIVRRGLMELLQDEFDGVVFGEAANGQEVRELVAQRRWNLMLLDIVMPGVNIARLLAEIREQDAAVPVLILSAFAEAEYAVQTVKAGANGYITKRHAATELVGAVYKVLDNQTYFSPDAQKALAAGLRGDSVDEVHNQLSKREFEVFCLIALGRTVKQIAGELAVSDKTVATYLARIRDKTGLSRHVDIARYALAHRLVE